MLRERKGAEWRGGKEMRSEGEGDSQQENPICSVEQCSKEGIKRCPAVMSPAVTRGRMPETAASRAAGSCATPCRLQGGCRPELFSSTRRTDNASTDGTERANEIRLISSAASSGATSGLLLAGRVGARRSPAIGVRKLPGGGAMRIWRSSIPSLSLSQQALGCVWMA